jgi:hypothetical protein
MFPQWGPCGERYFVSRTNSLFIHLLSLKSPHFSHEMGGETYGYHPWSSMWTEGLTYIGVWPGSPWGSFTTLLSLPQCHAAFSMIPSTLAWVDQSSVSQHLL